MRTEDGVNFEREFMKEAKMITPGKYEHDQFKNHYIVEKEASNFREALFQWTSDFVRIACK
jgi:hypothetical protein